MSRAAQVELRKTNTLRDRLEELCRQLQRENREVLEESKRRQEEEIKQRHSLQAKFSSAIDDVTEKLDAQQAERTKQLTENDALRVKLGEVGSYPLGIACSATVRWDRIPSTLSIVTDPPGFPNLTVQIIFFFSTERFSGSLTRSTSCWRVKI